MGSVLRAALALVLALGVLGTGGTAADRPGRVRADSPDSGNLVLLPVVQNGDGVSTLVSIQNTSPFPERFLITFFPGARQHLTGTVFPRAGTLVPDSALPRGVSSATVEAVAFLPTWTAASNRAAGLPVYWPPNVALTSFGGSPVTGDGPNPAQALLLGVGLDVAVQGGLADPQNLCANPDFAAFVAANFPNLACGPGLYDPGGYVWSFSADSTGASTLYVRTTGRNQGAQGFVGYFTETWTRLSEFEGVPGFDKFSPGAAVVVHRTDAAGPRVSEYEGIPFQRGAGEGTTPPGPAAIGTGAIPGAYPTGDTTGLATGFVGHGGFHLYAPLVMKDYHGWTSRLWVQHLESNYAVVVTYYDVAGNPVLEERAYTEDDGRASLLGGEALPDGFVGSAWLSTTADEGVLAAVVDQVRDDPPILMSYRAVPAVQNLAERVEAATPLAAGFGPALPEGTVGPFGGAVAFSAAPLVLSRYRDWSTGVAILNPNAGEVRVALHFRAENGGGYTVSDRIPARGVATLYESAASALPENFVGNVSLAAEFAPGVPAGVVPVVQQVNRQRGIGLAYNAVDSVFDPAAENDLPLVARGFRGYDTGVAIMNMNPQPGRAAGNLDVYTATGLLDRTVWRADSLGTTTVYLPNLRQVPAGFVGSAAAYVTATNQRPAAVRGFAPPAGALPAPTRNPATGLADQPGYLPKGLQGPVPPTDPSAVAGTGISTVVTLVDYDGTGDTAAAYGGFPVGGLFAGGGTGGLSGLARRCDVGAGVPGLPVFVWRAGIVPPDVPPATFLAEAVPPLAASDPFVAASILPAGAASGAAGGGLPAAFVAALGNGAYVTFTDAAGGYALAGLPPGAYHVQVGGFSAACPPLGAAGAGAAPPDLPFAYVAFANGEVDTVAVNAGRTANVAPVCLTAVGPVVQVGQVLGPAGPVNGAAVTAATLCAGFNAALPAGLGAPASLGGPASPSAAGGRPDAALAAFGLAVAGFTPTLPNPPAVATLPFTATSGVGVNTSAPGSLAVAGTDFSLEPGQGGYALTLPFFGTYRQTVTAPGFAPSVHLVANTAAVNLANLNVGSDAPAATPAPVRAVPIARSGVQTRAASPTARGAAATARASATGQPAPNVSAPALGCAPAARPGDAALAVAVPPGALDVLVYELTPTAPNGRTLRAVAPVHGRATFTVTVAGQAPGSSRTFVAQALHRGNALSSFSQPASCPPTR